MNLSEYYFGRLGLMLKTSTIQKKQVREVSLVTLSIGHQ